jgi:benzodiazapine receptor
MVKSLLATSAAVASTAAIGAAVSSDTTSAWYRSLKKPPFQPPAYIFPVVWTALYTDIAISSTRVFDGSIDREVRARFRARLLINLVLNASWSWVFFKSHRLAPAVAVAGALALSSVDLARQAGKVSPGAGIALVPYAVWCTFATVLSTAIWRDNPQR